MANYKKEPKHGTAYAYQGRGCRCGDCRKWRSDHSRVERGLPPHPPEDGGQRPHEAPCLCPPCEDHDRAERMIQRLVGAS